MIFATVRNRGRRRAFMLDLAMVVLGVALFGAGLGYVALCERL